MLTPRSVYRRFETDGVPSSGPHDPAKGEIVQLLEFIQSSGGQSVVKSSLAQLDATTPPAETYGGIVLSGVGAGYYSRASGAWIFGRGFPDTFAKVGLSGSGSAQSGTLKAGVNPSSIEVFFAKVGASNTGPLSLSISGGPARQVINLAGAPLSAGEWTGLVMFYLNEANQYQLLIDAGAAAAAAASAAAAAQSLADANSMIVPDNAVTTPKIAGGAVTGPTIAAEAVSYPKLDAQLKGRIDGWVAPRDFVGNAGTGSDDTAAMQAAMAVDAPLYIDRPYRIAAACNYSGGKTKRVFGNGDTSSLITMTAAAGHGLSKTSGTLIVEGVGITTTVDKAANTAAIYLGGTLSGRDMVDNCRLYGASGTVRLAMGVHVATDVIPTIRSNYILTCREYGVLLQNTVAGGGSEAVVMGNTFNTQEIGNAATAIAWTSGLGAQRIIGNIIQSYSIGVNVTAFAPLTKGSLLVIGNSFEGNFTGAIVLDRSSTLALLQSVIIVGNDFQNSNGGRALLTQNSAGGTSDWIRSIQFHDNSIRFGVTAPVQLNAGFLASVDGNIFEATASSLTCVVLAAAYPVKGQIGSNVYAGSGVVPYALNGNIGWTKVSTVAA